MSLKAGRKMAFVKQFIDPMLPQGFKCKLCGATKEGKAWTATLWADHIVLQCQKATPEQRAQVAHHHNTKNIRAQYTPSASRPRDSDELDDAPPAKRARGGMEGHVDTCDAARLERIHMRVARLICGCALRDSISAALGVRCAISGPVGLKTAPEPPRMPTVVPRKAYRQSGAAAARYSLEACRGEKRRHRIDRHRMGRCGTTSSQIVGGHMVNDVRRCGGSIGSKRHQKSRSRGILNDFWPFSRREAARLLPRFLQCVARLPAPTT